MPYAELYHHGIQGQKWGVRRFQNKDGSLTNAGKRRYLNKDRTRFNTNTDIVETLNNSKLMQDYVNKNEDRLKKLADLQYKSNKAYGELDSKTRQIDENTRILTEYTRYLGLDLDDDGNAPVQIEKMFIDSVKKLKLQDAYEQALIADKKFNESYKSTTNDVNDVIKQWVKEDIGDFETGYLASLTVNELIKQRINQ